jgi:hypothetical protein
MKKILSLLMCYVFLQAETFALRGGPGGAGTGNVSGTYSGVLIDTGLAGGTTDIGLFLLNASPAGASSGQMVIFSQSAADSEAYNCNLIGLSDASRGGSKTLFGVFSGAAAITANGVVKTISGQMTVKLSTAGNAQSPRLTGTASSRTAITTTITSTGTGTGTGTGSTTGVAPLKTYIVDGWQTSGTNNTGLAL